MGRAGIPLASVVITSFNYGRFLAEAIDSALNQTYPRTEVVVVDDGSTDGSPDLILSYGDRIRPVLKENGGQGSAFNAGFAAARGEVVCYLDSDDVLLSSAMERAVAGLWGTPASKVHWPMREIDASGAATGRSVPGPTVAQGDLLELTIENGPIAEVNVPTSGNAWPRWFLEEVLPVPEDDFRICADAYLFAMAPALGPIHAVQEAQACYRLHGSNSFGHGGPMRELLVRARLQMHWYSLRSEVLARFLRDRGIDTGPEAWDEHNGFRSWLRRVVRALEQIEEAMPARGKFVFLEDDQIGVGPIKDGMSAVSFRGGSGPPPQGAAAVAGLEEHRRSGVRHIAIAWPAFWWFDAYPEFGSYLASEAREVSATDDVRLFEFHG